MDTLQTLLSDGLPALGDTVLLIDRLVVGLMFAISGAYKLFDPERHKVMKETLDDADIPQPKPMTYFVSFNELLFGLLLAVGLLSIFAAGVLLIISVVAFITQGFVAREDDEDFLFWISGILMKHQVLLGVLLTFIIAFGQGRFALDTLLF